MACAGWGRVPHFTLHEPRLTAPYSSSSPALLTRLSPAPWEMLGLPEEGRRALGMGTPPGYLTRGLC